MTPSDWFRTGIFPQVERDRNDEPGTPMPEATADVLSEAFALYRTAHSLSEGQICVFKRMLCPLKKHLREQPMLFLRGGIGRWEGEIERIVHPFADCIVMVRHDEDGEIIFLAVDSKTLEPWPRREM